MPRILCVEDHDDSCKLLAVVLRTAHESYRVESAKNADGAIKLIFSDRFDAYVLDYWMPNIDGVELCKWIRAAGSTAPVIFYSGAVEATYRQNALDAGADAYLLKPHDLFEVPIEINRLLTPSVVHFDVAYAGSKE